MTAHIRISTSPPNEYERRKGDASYYCDLLAIEEWSNLAIVAAQTDELKGILKNRGIIGYIVNGYDNKEIGVTICYEDDEDEVMYCGIDSSGHARCEPAVNEALWHVANTAVGLPRGYRLKRDPRGTLRVV